MSCLSCKKSLKNSINELCDECCQKIHNCSRCNRFVLGSFIKNSLCWDCFSCSLNISKKESFCCWCNKKSELILCSSCENLIYKKKTNKNDIIHKDCCVKCKKQTNDLLCLNCVAKIKPEILKKEVNENTRCFSCNNLSFEMYCSSCFEKNNLSLYENLSRFLNKETNYQNKDFICFKYDKRLMNNLFVNELIKKEDFFEKNGKIYLVDSKLIEFYLNLYKVYLKEVKILYSIILCLKKINKNLKLPKYLLVKILKL